jgi:hypothetical protein
MAGGRPDGTVAVGMGGHRVTEVRMSHRGRSGRRRLIRTRRAVLGRSRRAGVRRNPGIGLRRLFVAGRGR